MDLDRSSQMVVISNDDQGIQFLSELREEMQRHGICLAFVNEIPESMEIYRTRTKIYDEQIVTSSAKIIIIYGDKDKITVGWGLKFLLVMKEPSY